ncbi:MAG: hypothetical protein HY952_02665 [Elusimicrobia bacterium]|nr:hypothetical protein [Elusimicrobiota bacterium]
MKTLITLLLPLFFSAAYATPDDCAKSADACSSGNKKMSAFLAASATEPAPAVKPAAPVKKAAVKKPVLVKKELPAAVAVSSAPAPAPAAPQPADNGISSPAWLLLVGGGLAGLYFYLGAGARKGRGK